MSSSQGNSIGKRDYLRAGRKRIVVMVVVCVAVLPEQYYKDRLYTDMGKDRIIQRMRRSKEIRKYCQS